MWELSARKKSAVKNPLGSFLASRTCQHLSNSTLYRTLSLLVLAVTGTGTNNNVNAQLSSLRQEVYCQAWPPPLQLVRFPPQLLSFIGQRCPTCNNRWPEAECTSNCKVSSGGEEVHPCIELRFSATYLASMYLFLIVLS